MIKLTQFWSHRKMGIKTAASKFIQHVKIISMPNGLKNFRTHTQRLASLGRAFKRHSPRPPRRFNAPKMGATVLCKDSRDLRIAPSLVDSPASSRPLRASDQWPLQEAIYWRYLPCRIGLSFRAKFQGIYPQTMAWNMVNSHWSEELHLQRAQITLTTHGCVWKNGVYGYPWIDTSNGKWW